MASVDVILPKRIRDLDDDDLQKIYIWVDEMSLSRPKKNIARDFADGVLVAEICKYFLPRLVELHNYAAANANRLKENNWFLLNRKVFSKLNFEISSEVIRDLSQGQPWYIENILIILREKIDYYLAHRHHTYPSGENHGGVHQSRVPAPHSWDDILSDQPEVDQSYCASFPWDDSDGGQSPTKAKDNFSPKGPSSRKAGGSYVRKLKSFDMLPKAILDEKREELKMKNDAEQMLQGKIKRLEQLIHIKDMRIEDLTNKVENLEDHLNHTQHPRKPAAQPETNRVKGQDKVTPTRKGVPTVGRVSHPRTHPQSVQWKS